MTAANERVRSLVNRPVVEVDPDATLRQVAETLAEDYIGIALVTVGRPTGAPGSRADGVISERDIVRAIAEGANPDMERARDVMTGDVATAAADDSVASVTRTMLDNEIRHVPITENGVVVGVVSERDALRAYFGDAGTPS